MAAQMMGNNNDNNAGLGQMMAMSMLMGKDGNLFDDMFDNDDEDENNNNIEDNNEDNPLNKYMRTEYNDRNSGIMKILLVMQHLVERVMMPRPNE